MKLAHLLNKQIIIARMAEISGDKLAYTTVTADMGHIQPIDNSNSEGESGVFGKNFRLYMSGDADINEGDRLRDFDGNYYTVVSDGISRRTFGSFDYLIVIIQKNT